jgi:hypothetical protein
MIRVPAFVFDLSISSLLIFLKSISFLIGSLIFLHIFQFLIRFFYQRNWNLKITQPFTRKTPNQIISIFLCKYIAFLVLFLCELESFTKVYL